MKFRLKNYQFDQEVGRRVRIFRRMRDISQHDLGKMLSVSHQQVQKYESGKDKIALITLLCISNILEVSIMDLIPKEFEKSIHPMSPVDQSEYQIYKADSEMLSQPVIQKV